MYIIFSDIVQMCPIILFCQLLDCCCSDFIVIYSISYMDTTRTWSNSDNYAF
jgi:hypothetical protein